MATRFPISDPPSPIPNPRLDGVLVIDKPQGLTSHDVVAVARRCLGEKRIGHTGTLDPLATGVLPLACGRATRLVRFLTSADKDYEASIRFGITTDSDDISGTEIARSAVRPTREQVESALASFRGEHLQVPPIYSAKKVAGRRAYELARRDQAVTLAPVPVSVSRAELLAFGEESAAVALTCSAGFYVRSFARQLGQTLGCGATLESLRRTRSGTFNLGSAVELRELQESPTAVLDRMVPLEALLTDLPVARLTDEGRRRVAHGQGIDAAHVTSASALGATPTDVPSWVRLLDREGHLVALATPGERPDSLRPTVVLIYN